MPLAAQQRDTPTTNLQACVTCLSHLLRVAHVVQEVQALQLQATACLLGAGTQRAYNTTAPASSRHKSVLGGSSRWGAVAPLQRAACRKDAHTFCMQQAPTRFACYVQSSLAARTGSRQGLAGLCLPPGIAKP